jgi:hypothetical protein
MAAAPKLETILGCLAGKVAAEPQAKQRSPNNEGLGSRRICLCPAEQRIARHYMGQGWLVEFGCDSAHPRTRFRMFSPLIFNSTKEANEPVGRCPWPFFVVNICGERGEWDASFSLKVAERWPKARHEFQKLPGVGFWNLNQGEVQFVKVSSHVWVANVIARSGPPTVNGVTPLDYEGFREGLTNIAYRAEPLKGQHPHFSTWIGRDWSRLG